MTVFLIRRLIQATIVLAAMSFLVFVGVFAIGNPADILVSPEATQIERQAVIERFGLDQPWWVQYARFLWRAAHGDMGDSFRHATPAVSLILERFPATLELAILAMVMAVVLGIPLGLLAGIRSQSLIGRLIMGFSILGFSVPTFWVGLIMIMVFSAYLGLLPSFGRGPTVTVLGIPISLLSLDGLRHALMPAVNLALFKISLVIRLTRSGVDEVLLSDFVKFARARGLSNGRIVGVHILKNILIPVVTILGIQFGSLLAFSVVTETIFSWPGIGKLLIESITHLDRPVVVAYLMMSVLLFTLVNLLVDIAYSLLDPRIRLEGLGE